MMSARALELSEEVARDLLENLRLSTEQLKLGEEIIRDLIKGANDWEEYRDSFLTALEAGNYGPFFDTLKSLGGSLLYEPRTSQVIQEKTRSALFNPKDRAFLARLKKETSFIGSGPMPQLDLESQHTEALTVKSKSAAVTRLVNKYNKWGGHTFRLNPDLARRQAEEDFKATTRFPEKFQKEIIKAFREKIDREGES